MKQPKNFLNPTLNNMGYSPEYPDKIQKAFIQSASYTKEPLLDIGAAFGVASLRALANGAWVIANDLDIRHLEIINQKASSISVGKLDILLGRMPSDLEFTESSLGSVLISRVLHFMTPQEILESIRIIFNWIKSGGKIFIVATTPYIKILEPFIPIYNQRKKNGELWPGLIEDARTYQSMPVEAMPTFVHLMDRDVIRRVVKETGFHILELDYFAADCPQEWLYDGRELIGCIAKKL